MLVGYMGMALAAKAMAPRIGLGSLMAAAVLLDLLLGLFVILHLEAASVPGDFSTRHALVYSFPWSHSLAAAVLWSLAAGFVWTWSGGAGKYFGFAPAVIAGAVFSHWVLDFIVLPPELPLWGPGSPTVGLGLGRPEALYLEIAIAAIGLGLFLWRRRPEPVQRAVVVGMVLIAAMLSAAEAFRTSPAPDVATAMAASLLILFGAIIAAALADRETA